MDDWVNNIRMSWENHGYTGLWWIMVDYYSGLYHNGLINDYDGLYYINDYTIVDYTIL